METEPEKLIRGDDPLANIPAKLRKERISVWWTFYMVGCVLFPVGWAIAVMDEGHFNFEGPIVSLLLVPFVALLLPIGLADVLACLIAALQHREWHPTYHEAESWLTLTIPLAYIIFAVHNRLTANATKERNFILLMFSFILLICSCLIGCTREASLPLGVQ